MKNLAPKPSMPGTKNMGEAVYSYSPKEAFRHFFTFFIFINLWSNKYLTSTERLFEKQQHEILQIRIN